MSMLRSRGVFVLVAGLLLQRTMPAVAQTPDRVHFRVSGRVYDADSKEWLRHVSVRLPTFHLKTETDTNGHYALEGDFPPGIYFVCFSAPDRVSSVVIVRMTAPGSMGGGVALGRTWKTRTDSAAVASLCDS